MSSPNKFKSAAKDVSKTLRVVKAFGGKMKNSDDIKILTVPKLKSKAKSVLPPKTKNTLTAQ